MTRGRCTACRRRHHLTRAGELGHHPDALGEPCAGVGTAPIDPAADDTPDVRDRLTRWDSIRQLERIAGKDKVTAKDLADRARLRRIRDESAAGNSRVPLGTRTVAGPSSLCDDGATNSEKERTA